MLIGILVIEIIMALLDELFPSMPESESGCVPRWENSDEPWKILDSSWAITEQIGEKTGSPEGVFIHPTALIGEHVTIEGPAYIGKNAIIRHSAYLRGGSWISEGALVGHSTEIKNSILLPHSKAPHFNYVGDSILGFYVNLGAGTKLSNVRNDRAEIILSHKDDKKIITGMRKIGALVGDHSQIGCNVVANPGTIIYPKTSISPNKTVSRWID